MKGEKGKHAPPEIESWRAEPTPRTVEVSLGGEARKDLVRSISQAVIGIPGY
jgi:hypothetical protein